MALAYDEPESIREQDKVSTLILPTARAGSTHGKVQVSGSYSGPPPFGWERTSKTTHTLKGGDIFVVAPAMLSVTGEMDLYLLSESDRNTIISNRNYAQFQNLEPLEE